MENTTKSNSMQTLPSTMIITKIFIINESQTIDGENLSQNLLNHKFI